MCLKALVCNLGTDFELFFGAGQFENCRHVIFLPVLVLACLVDLRHRECSGWATKGCFTHLDFLNLHLVFSRIWQKFV